MTFAQWFNDSIHPPLCEGRMIKGVLLGLDARLLLRKEMEYMTMVNHTVMMSFPPPYTMGFYGNCPIGPMNHPGIAVILAKPKPVNFASP